MRRRPQAGFSLVETLVALALLGMALLLTMVLLAQEPQVERRLLAHREALEVLEAAHEEIRGGMALRPGTERLDWQRLYAPPRRLETAADLTLWTTVDPLTPPGLYRVRLRARYAVGRGSFDREVETRVWRP